MLLLHFTPLVLESEERPRMSTVCTTVCVSISYATLTCETVRIALSPMIQLWVYV